MNRFPNNLVFIVLLLVTTLTKADDPLSYPVNSIDPESRKFDTVYRAVLLAEQETAKSSGELRTVKILQHIKEQRYLASLQEVTALPGSGARAIASLFGETASRVTVNEEQTVVIDIPSDSLLPDNTVKRLPIKLTTNTYQYISVTGAKKTVVIAEIPKPPPPND